MSIFSKQIIPAYAEALLRNPTTSEPQLCISEFYYDTIQGEGIYAGAPAAFLRLTGCTMNCKYCDTKEVWRTGNFYTVSKLLDLIPRDAVQHLHNGQHLVLTGGSPLLQQEQLVEFIRKFYDVWCFKPFIEIENECVIMPRMFTEDMVDCWNNSPKLASSGVDKSKRYKPDIISHTAGLKNSWFKFVITCEDDWREIEYSFLRTDLIKHDQVILMPEGTTREEVETHRDMVVQMAIKHSVRYCTREHIVIWDKKTGI